MVIRFTVLGIDVHIGHVMLFAAVGDGVFPIVLGGTNVLMTPLLALMLVPSTCTTPCALDVAAGNPAYPVAVTVPATCSAVEGAVVPIPTFPVLLLIVMALAEPV